MIKFSPTEISDVPQIKEWIESDPYHCDELSSNGGDLSCWLTGQNALMAGCVEDSSGPVFYYRFERDGEFIRMHEQFAPPQQVRKSRVARAIMRTLTIFTTYGKEQGAKGLIFESVSPSLIRFGGVLGFKPAPEGNNDYVLLFEEK